jgi:hypothetical protein
VGKSLRVAFVASLALSSVVLVGCNAAADATKRIVDEIAATPPMGYVITGQGQAYSSPEHWISLAKPADLTVAEECAAILDYGKTIGATHWFNDFVNQVTFPIEGYEAQSQIACVNTLGGAWDNEGNLEASAATGMFGLWSANTTLGGTPGIELYFQVNVGDGDLNVEIYPSLSDSEDWVGDRVGEWSWDEAFTKLGSGNYLVLTALDPLGSFRAAHPQAEPDSLETVKAAYAESEFNDASGTIEVVEDPSSREVFLRVEFGPESYLLPLCVSVAPFDPDYFGVADPGFGYGFGYDDGLRPKHQFGSAVGEDCPPVNPLP